MFMHLRNKRATRGAIVYLISFGTFVAAHVPRIVQYGTIPGGWSLVPPHLVGKVEGLGDGEGGSLGLSRDLTKMKESGKELSMRATCH